MWKTVLGICAILLAVNLAVAIGAFNRAVWRSWTNPRRSGFTAQTFVDQEGNGHGYVLFVPHDLPDDERVPLLMFLNGGGEAGEDGVQQISNNFGEPVWEMKGRFPFVCLAPQCKKNWNLGGEDMRTAIAILDAVVEEYDVDPDRLFLTGVSSGGAGVWQMATQYPEKFAAIVPMAGYSCGVPIEDAVTIFADVKLPIWNFFNEGDKPDLVDFNHRIRDQLIQAGLSPIFREYGQQGHNCWDVSYRSPAMYEWLWSQNRQQNANQAPFEEMVGETTPLSEWETKGSAEWSITDEKILVTRNAAASVDSRHLLYKPLLDDFDVHFDYRSADEAPCNILLGSAEEPEADILVRIEWPRRGTGGIFVRDTGECLSQVIPFGQRSLLSGRWNDIRLSLRDERLVVVVNGARLFDVSDPRLKRTRRFGLSAGETGLDNREWRYLRTQPCLDAAIPAAEAEG